MDGLNDIRAICWDWNGTLLDDVDVCLEVMNDVLRELGEAPLSDVIEYRSVFRFPIRDFYADVGTGDDRFAAAVASYLQRLEARASESKLQPHPRQTLADISALGIRQVLASATLSALLDLQLAPHAVADTFERVLAIDDPLRASKRDVIGRWLEETGLPAAQVLLIGDTNHDREIAHELGSPFIHFGAGHQTHSDLGLSIDSLDQLQPLLQAPR